MRFFEIKKIFDVFVLKLSGTVVIPSAEKPSSHAKFRISFTTFILSTGFTTIPLFRVFPDFELRLHQNDSLSVVFQQIETSGKHEFQGNETYVDCQKILLPFTSEIVISLAFKKSFTTTFCFQKVFVQLGLSHVDGINDFRAVFQHAVGEPAVRRADIDAFQIFNVDMKLRYRLLKFISAKAFKLVVLKTSTSSSFETSYDGFSVLHYLR